jgi:recombination protein RecA
MAKEKEGLDELIDSLQAKFGKGSFRRPNEIEVVDVIPVGDISIDYALGVGGFPRGRIIEIYGNPSAGKTTLTLHTIAEAQKQGLQTCFIDVEHALDPEYSANLGVDLSQLIISQPDNAEDALSIVHDLVESNRVGLIVLDSVASMVPKAELEGEMGQSHVALSARLMSQALRKLTAIISKTKCTVIFINQLRNKIGGYGNPEVTPGGEALKFYSSIRVEVRKGSINATKAEVDNNEVRSNDVTIKVVKNKVAPPFRKVIVPIVFGEGFDKIQSLISMSSHIGIIEKSGSWYSYKEKRLGQGKANVVTLLKDNPDLLKEIDSLTRKELFPKIDSKRSIVEEKVDEEVKD